MFCTADDIEAICRTLSEKGALKDRDQIFLHCVISYIASSPTDAFKVSTGFDVGDINLQKTFTSFLFQESYPHPPLTGSTSLSDFLIRSRSAYKLSCSAVSLLFSAYFSGYPTFSRHNVPSKLSLRFKNHKLCLMLFAEGRLIFMPENFALNYCKIIFS